MKYLVSFFTYSIYSTFFVILLMILLSYIIYRYGVSNTAQWSTYIHWFSWVCQISFSGLVLLISDRSKEKRVIQKFQNWFTNHYHLMLQWKKIRFASHCFSKLQTIIYSLVSWILAKSLLRSNFLRNFFKIHTYL